MAFTENMSQFLLKRFYINWRNGGWIIRLANVANVDILWRWGKAIDWHVPIMTFSTGNNGKLITSKIGLIFSYHHRKIKIIVSKDSFAMIITTSTRAMIRRKLKRGRWRRRRRWWRRRRWRRRRRWWWRCGWWWRRRWWWRWGWW